MICNRRDDLRSGRPAANDADALVRQVDAVKPLGRVKLGPFEIVDAFDIGEGRDMQRPRRRNQKIDGVALTVRCLEMPTLTVELRLRHLGAKHDIASKIVFVGDLDHV